MNLWRNDKRMGPTPVLGILIAALFLSSAPASAQDTPLARSSDAHFIENLGQWPIQAAFVGYCPGIRVQVAPDSVSYQCFAPGGDGSRGVLVRQVFEGASPDARVVGEARGDSVHSWFLGDDPSKWVRGAPSYHRVRIAGLYPGVDLVLREEGGRVKYDMLLDSAARLEHVVVRWEGVEEVIVEDDGALAVRTELGELRQTAGRSWQVQVSGATTPVTCRQEVLAGNRMRFVVSDDASLPLVVDPVVFWASYLGSSTPSGGSEDEIRDVAFDDERNVVTVGSAGSERFPTTPGAYFDIPDQVNTRNAFVVKFAADGSSLIYSAMIGGLNWDQAEALALNTRGNVCVVGWTFSDDFPTVSAFDPTKNSLNTSAFALELSAAGDDLEYSTFLEGPGVFDGAQGFAVAVTHAGAAIVGGSASAGFPVTPGAHDSTNVHGDGFVARLDPGGALEWATYVGGDERQEVHDLVIAPNGDVIVTGLSVASASLPPATPGCAPSLCGNAIGTNQNVLVAGLDTQGSELLGYTVFGGSSMEAGDDVALDASGDILVTGKTVSTDFPVTPDALQPSFHQIPGDPILADGFLVRLDPAATFAKYATYWGTGARDEITDVKVDVSGVTTVCGFSSLDLPVTPGAHDTTWNGGFDFFVSRFDPKGTRLIYSTFIGGPDHDFPSTLAVGPAGRVAVAGFVLGVGFPVTPGAFDTTHNGGQGDATIAVFDPQPTGVEPFGDSQPACLGPLTMYATEMPKVGSTDFALLCSGAPPDAQGWLHVAEAGSDVAALPAEPLTGLGSGRRYPVVSDSRGFVEVALPELLSEPGQRYRARFLFRNPPTCAGPARMSWSHGLLISVQP